jgi:hypothetical protein
MPIDVRIPISGLFLVVGFLLLGYGSMVQGVGSQAGSLNAFWGGLMVLFSLVLGYFGMRAEKRGGV